MKAFATAHPGLESILAGELALLGLAAAPPDVGGVEFDADPRSLLVANLGLRTAGRVLVRIAEFRARTFPELERHGEQIPWEQFVGEDVGVHLRVTSKKSRLYHEGGIAERLERGLLTRCPGVAVISARGDVDDEERSVVEPSTVQRFVVRFHRDVCTISADSSGPPLHRRGYRIEVGKAPLRETLAAALLLGSRWSGIDPLVDPMCGSGTIPIEAALIATNTPPGGHRRFSLEGWPTFSPAVGSEVRKAMAAQARPLGVAISGFDRDAGAIAAAEANAARAGLRSAITWRREALSSADWGPGRGWVVTNPPYGARLGDKGPLRDLYAQLGNVLRAKAPGWQIAMVSADRRLEQQARLDWTDVAATENGGLKVRFVRATVPS